MFLNLEQCFPKTGPWTIYGHPESFNWSVGKKLDPKYKNISQFYSEFHFVGQDWFPMVRSTLCGTQEKKYVVNGAFIEKVWETQTRGSTKF